MLRSLIALVLVAPLLIACGDDASDSSAVDMTHPEAVAAAWLDAWLAGDGSHTQYELEEVPEIYRRLSWTGHVAPKPEGGPIVNPRYLSTTVGGYIWNEDKSVPHPFDLVDHTYRSKVRAQVRDRRVMVGDYEVVIPKVPPTKGGRTTARGIGAITCYFEFTPEDGKRRSVMVQLRPPGSFKERVEAGDDTTWLVLPPGPRVLGD